MHASLLGFCLESLVLGDDLLGQAMRLVRGIDVTRGFHVDRGDEARSVWAARGHYLGSGQTLELMQTEYIYPKSANRMSPKEWNEAGKPLACWTRPLRARTKFWHEGRVGDRPRHRSRRSARRPTTSISGEDTMTSGEHAEVLHQRCLGRSDLGTSGWAWRIPPPKRSYAKVALGNEADADRAIMAARAAFDKWTTTPVKDRIALVRRILEIYNAKAEEFAQVMSTEMGAPIEWARSAQAWAGQVHLESTIKAAEEFHWEEMRGTTKIVREGIGVCALITPWNWPMNQIACKVAPALVAGCTMVLKPSEIAPLSGTLFRPGLSRGGRSRRCLQPGSRHWGRTWARACPRTPRSIWCPSPARPGRARRLPPPPPRR